MVEVSAQAREQHRGCLGFSSVVPTPLRVDIAGRWGCLFPYHPPPGDVIPRQPMAGVSPSSPSSPSPFLFPPSLGLGLSRRTRSSRGVWRPSGKRPARQFPSWPG